MNREQTNQALQVALVFEAIRQALGVPMSAPVDDVLAKVQELQRHAAELDFQAYANEDAMTELRAMLECSDKALAHAQAAIARPPVYPGLPVYSGRPGPVPAAFNGNIDGTIGQVKP